METTTNLELPYLMPSQAQKHVTHNEALGMLDAIVQLSVLDRDLAAPPASPAEGDRYIVGADPTDTWAGKAGQVVAWQDGAWTFFQPRAGWLAFITDENLLVCHDGSEWTELAGTGAALQQVPLLGLGATADETNPLTVCLNNVLFVARPTSEAGDGDLRIKISKEAIAGTASQIFQTGFSARAEAGLTGSDDYTVKVSSDGSTWADAMVVSSATAKVRFPATSVLTDHCLNLLQDSGRFATGSAASITASPFAFPAYLTLLNSSSASGLGKFIHDNNDYGGAAGAMQADVKDLIDRIRDASWRRYGLEFWVAQVTMGAGVSSALSVDGNTYYSSLRTQQGPRMAAMTWHCYVRALDAPILIRWSGGQTILKDSVEYGNHVVVSPADGWVSITVTDVSQPRFSTMYSPDVFAVSAQVSGHRWLLACPALVAGQATVDADVGVVAGYNRWTA